MKSNRPLALVLFLLVLALSAACGGGGGGGGGEGGGSSCPVLSAITLPNGSSITAPAGDNVMTLTVNGSNCSAATSANYPNKPCVSVILCDVAGGNCQTINDILLDTGDFGFRVFQQALTAPLLAALDANPVQVGGQNLYECVEYGDGSTVWGPVRKAVMKLGDNHAEQTVVLPIHVTGSTDGNPSTVCTGSPRLLQPGTASNQARYNGVLGVGLRAQDCRSTCETVVNNGVYYKCPAGTCSGSLAPAATSQVRNPVNALSTNNNGVIISLPSVPSTGTSSATGYVVFGIGTAANNALSGVTAYGASSNGYFTTAFNGTTYPKGFLDSGSNGIFFYNYGIPLSGAFYAPSCALGLSATNTGGPLLVNTGTVNFQIENVNTLAATGNKVFYNLGAPLGNGTMFDWGLPFFLGRNVYVHIEDTASPLGTGPYWAY
jgi:hypothetical protein